LPRRKSARNSGLARLNWGWYSAHFCGHMPLGSSRPAGALIALIVFLVIVPFWSLMTALTSVASGIASLVGLRFVFGLGEAGGFPTATRAMQLWFPRDRESSTCRYHPQPWHPVRALRHGCPLRPQCGRRNDDRAIRKLPSGSCVDHRHVNDVQTYASLCHRCTLRENR